LPGGEGAAMAMKLALADAKIGPEDVDYINAHGTSTELNDIAESTAIKTVFGAHAYRVPISSTKSCLGHMLGATAAVELIAAIKAINNSLIPPTINLDNPDERCDLKIDYVPLKAREARVDVALSNSFGFGGHNACLVVGRV
jgi:3-oxoacyl-[acyl-carrier-protein] synthase II